MALSMKCDSLALRIELRTELRTESHLIDKTKIDKVA